MSIVQTSPTDRPDDLTRPTDPEVLIKEARRHQRRRWGGVAAVAGAVALAAIGLGVTSGGGTPADPPATTHGAGPGQPLVASWSRVGGPEATIPPHATITSMLVWRGRLYAAGNWSGPGHVERLNCSHGCDPVVWALKHNGRWKAIFAASATDSEPFDRLVATRRFLLLFRAQNTTTLYRSTNGQRFTAVKIPAGMRILAMRSVASDSGRVVAEFDNGYIDDQRLPFRNPTLNPVFVSGDGIHWRQSVDPDRISFHAISGDKDGFTATGTAARHGRWFLLGSRTGLSWTATPVPASPHDDLQVATSGAHTVLAALPAPTAMPNQWGKRIQLWHVSRGGRPVRASVNGPSPTLMQTSGLIPVLLNAPGEFLASTGTNNGFWISKTGIRWQPVVVRSRPPAALTPRAATLDGNSLLVAETASALTAGRPKNPTTFWRLQLRGR